LALEDFAEILRQHAPKIAKYFTYRVPIGEVEDLSSEVILIAWKKRSHCPQGSELPWLYRISGYVLANHRRKNLRNLTLPLFDSDLTSPSAEEIFLNDSALKSAWQKLGSGEQTILALAAFEDLDIPDIAVVLGISKNAVSIRLHRARKKLESILKDIEG
jgi:RNA polymerase sigma-70 factor (ECF subfamily)